jgi:hypothetical protein
MIVPFQIPWDPKGLADLKRRLSATRWNDAVVSDWSYGMERKFLQQLIGYWRDEYDWAERRSALNRMPHFHHRRRLWCPHLVGRVCRCACARRAHLSALGSGDEGRSPGRSRTGNRTYLKAELPRIKPSYSSSAV